MTVEDPFLGRGASLLRAVLGTVTAVSIEGKAAGSLRAGGGGRLATVVPVHSSLSMWCFFLYSAHACLCMGRPEPIRMS